VRRRTRSPVVIGLIALVVIVVLVFLGFTKDVPFTKPYEVNAVFTSANSIRPGSPVRIAGVDVGKVKEVRADEDNPNAAVVVLQIDDDGLPLHEDATAKIRPRIFLEGNFFVDLKSGSPEAPILDDGGTLKVTQTATPVQLDQVLTSLQSDTRQDLKDVRASLNETLTSKPTAAEDRDSHPLARG
jgi:ABC-type transporter Mla subunit MlaD